MSVTRNLVTIPDPFSSDVSPFEAQVSKAIGEMVQAIETLQVEDEGAFKRATFLYSKAREWRKVVEDKRKALTEPMRRQTAMVNEQAKALTEPLDRVISLANSKAVNYQTKQQEQDSHIAELLDGGAILVPSKITPIGAAAKIVTKKVMRYRITNEELIPDRYWQVNKDLLQISIDSGNHSIPGIEVYEETQQTLRKV